MSRLHMGETGESGTGEGEGRVDEGRWGRVEGMGWGEGKGEGWGR